MTEAVTAFSVLITDSGPSILLRAPEGTSVRRHPTLHDVNVASIDLLMRNFAKTISDYLTQAPAPASDAVRRALQRREES